MYEYIFFSHDRTDPYIPKKSGTLSASGHLLTGFMRAVASKDGDSCSQYHLCEAARSAAAEGHIGQVIVRAAR